MRKDDLGKETEVSGKEMEVSGKEIRVSGREMEISDKEVEVPEALREELFEGLERYIRENWIPSEGEKDDGWHKDGGITLDRKASPKENRIWDELSKGGTSRDYPSSAVRLEDLIGEVGKSFHEVLFEKIAESGMTDVEVYKRANIDRKLFSKIRSNPAYHPRKSTVLALAISMRLDMSETEDLLSRAEYAFSPGSKSDVIVRYFIERGVHDIHTINIALYEHGLPILE